MLLERKPKLSFWERQTVCLSLEGPNLRMLIFSNRKIAGWLSLPFNPKFISSGKIVDPQGLGKVVKELFTSWGIRGKIICALSGLGCLSHIIPIPKLKGINLSEVAKREARRLLSFNPETQYLYQYPLPLKDKSQVFLLVVPKDLILSLIQTFQVVGRRISRIEFKPLALLHCLPTPTAIVVHSEPFLAEIVIVVDRSPVLIRSLYLGEELLSSNYVSERIISEVSTTIGYYRESYREKALREKPSIYLSGSLAQDESFREGLRSATGYQLLPLPCPLTVPEETPLPLFMVNIGLFLGAE